MADTTALQDLPETPAGWASRWTAEFTAARKNQEDWWKRSEAILDRYLDKREIDPAKRNETRLNLFTANTQNMESLLFGKTPQVGVERRYADSADDVARVAAELLERLLNTDLEKNSDTQQEAFKNALGDRLRPGLGNVRLRYEAQFQTQPETPAILDEEGNEVAPAVPEQEVKVPGTEKVHTDYVYWKDQLWSPARTFSEVRWWAFANDMSEEAFRKRFGEQLMVAFTNNVGSEKGRGDKEQYKDPLARCRVWEIWDKERKCADWFVEGYSQTLDHKEDPLGIDGFWPFPRPLFANLTTSRLLPTPDYCIAQDLYEGIDTLETRINLLEDAVRVAGVYDKTNEPVKRLLSEKGKNALYPVDGWAVMAEAGGLRGVVDWFPLEQIVAALDKLRECRTEKIGLLYQVTGMSDILRGQASEQATATEQAIKARFASVRVQSMQDEFARFCSDAQRIKSDIITKHFDKETILHCSNAKYLPENDAALADQAVDLILSGELDYRVVVNPDSISLTDYAALKQERTEFAGTLAQYFQGMVPMIQMLAPVGAGAPAVNFTLQMGQVLAAGLKGSKEMEGIFDEFIAELKQIQEQAAMNPQPPQPNPQVQVAQIKAQAETGKAQADMAQTQMDMQSAVMQHHMDMQKLGVEQAAAQQDHNRSMQSQEGQERVAALKQVDKVTGQ